MTNILVVPKADYLIFEIDSEVGQSLSYVDRLPVKIADFYSLPFPIYHPYFMSP